MPRNSTNKRPRNALRRGTVYLAVLGTALIASVLALSAIGLQRIQYHRLAGTQVVRQTQFNAESALELGLLQMTKNDAWRSARDAQSYLFVDRDLGNGSSCDLQVLDATTDASAAAADRPATLIGTGSSASQNVGGAHASTLQRAMILVDPRREAHDCLKPTGTSLPGSWQTVFDYYGNPANATQIQVTSLPTRTKANGATLDERSFGLNISAASNDANWYDADLLAPSDFASAAVERRTNVGNPQHSASIRVMRDSRRGGVANRLQSSLLKPSTQYRVDIEIWSPGGNWFQAYVICRTGASYQIVSGTGTIINSSDGATWQTRSFTITTPSWATKPQDIYFALNSDPWGGDNTFYVDNIDVYETNARFLYQTVLGTTAQNPTGTYWIDCQNNKLVIERSRIFGTLLVINPGPGSCIDYGPTNMSPAIAGYPALLVSNSNGNTFAIRSTPDPSSNATDDSLSEVENGVNYNSTGAPHNKALGTDNNVLDDTYDSEIRGLVLVSGNLTYANNPTIRGKVLTGGTTSGTATVEYQPAPLLNPPPPLGVFYQYRYDRRPGSAQKVTQ